MEKDLEALTKEVSELGIKLKDLNDEELASVFGGANIDMAFFVGRFAGMSAILEKRRLAIVGAQAAPAGRAVRELNPDDYREVEIKIAE